MIKLDNIRIHNKKTEPVIIIKHFFKIFLTHFISYNIHFPLFYFVYKKQNMKKTNSLSLIAEDRSVIRSMSFSKLEEKEAEKFNEKDYTSSIIANKMQFRRLSVQKNRIKHVLAKKELDKKIYTIVSFYIHKKLYLIYIYIRNQ